MDTFSEDPGDQGSGVSAPLSNVGDLGGTVGGSAQSNPLPGPSNIQVTTSMEQGPESASAPISSSGEAGEQPHSGPCPSVARMVTPTKQGSESATSPVSALGQVEERSTCSPSLPQSQESTQSTGINRAEACSFGKFR